MAPMPQLRVRGTCFVLTGRMWTERRHIEQAILRHGGLVAPRVIDGDCTLVIAANNLQRDADNKWRPRGKITKKVESAIAIGAQVYHERQLADALSNGGASRLRAGPLDVTRTAKQQAKQARERAPEWNDEMQSRLEANMRETAELLASF